MARVAMTLSVPDQTGAARMLFYFARAMTVRGHQVTVFHGPPPDASEHGSVLAELRQCGVETMLVPILARPVPPFARMLTAKAAKGSDVVIGVNQRDRAVAISVADTLGVPAVLSVQNQHNFWGPFVVPQLKKWYYARTLRNSQVLCICTSNAVKDEVVEMGVPQGRTRVLHNGVEVDRYAARPDAMGRVRDELGLAADDLMLVNVGRLDVQKAQDLLLESWDRSDPPDNAHLVLVGDTTDGSQEARSTKFKADLLAARSQLSRPDSVHMLGWRDDVQDLLSAADAYVHSARWEGWPLTVVEAMSAGLPFIMTDCSGPPNGYADGKQGFLVETGNVDAFAAALRKLFATPPSEMAAMGQASHRLAVERYDIEVVGADFATLIEEAIRNG